MNFDRSNMSTWPIAAAIGVWVWIMILVIFL